MSATAVRLPYLRVANVQDGYVDLLEVKQIAIAPGSIERYSLAFGDVLLTEGGDFDKLGRGCVWRAQIQPCLHQNHIFVVRPDTSRLLPEFLAAYCSGGDGKRYFLGCSKQTTNLASINSTQLKNMPLVLPSILEQHRIATLLEAWGEAVALTERLIAAKRQQFEYVRTTVLTGRTRLPGFVGEWIRIPLSDVLTEHGLLSTGREEVFSVSVHRGLVNQIEHLGRSFAASSTAHYRRVKPGDIVYTKSPTGEFPLGIIKQSKTDREVIVSPLYGVFTPETYALGTILDAYLSAPSAAQAYLAPLVQKGAKNTIAVTNDRFLEGRLCLPREAAEQEAIADMISAALTEINQLTALADRLRIQKRGLVDKLLSGAWRVPAGADASTPGRRLIVEAAE